MKKLNFLNSARLQGCAVLTLLTLLSCHAQLPGKATVYITTPDKSQLLSKQEITINLETAKNLPEILVNSDKTYQTMEGFGFALTGGSAILINAMDAEPRARLMEELFGKGKNSIGVSYIRISIGASDLSDRVFSYDDLRPGETDPEMKNFSIAPEKKDLIPVLKLILKLNPDIRILGSPWSPPVWMKTNGSSKGGSLKPVFYDAYALYFVKYIRSMKEEGIRIDAITIQNEPLHPGNNPSMYMPASEQAAFIKRSLGPAFRKAGIDTKIIIYDHNPLHAEYPIEVLNDKDAAQYVDGTAFHMYEGSVDDIMKVHEAHPDKNLYFTEQWVGAPGDFALEFKWHTRTLIIGATRNWCRNVIEWNLAADPAQDPHTDGGCLTCLGAITIDGNTITRNPAYYIIAQVAPFVVPGSIRIESNMPESLPNVAFRTPDGKMILIVINDSDKIREFRVKHDKSSAVLSLAPGAAATLVW